MNVSLTTWSLLLAFVFAMLLLDLFLHRSHHEIKFKEAAIWSSIWVACGLGVGGVIWAQYGSEYGLQYLSGYVIEKSLAIDNVFVWGLLFAAFAVPKKYQHRVLFLGVVGALAMRSVMIIGGSALIKEFAWILYIFGAFLVYTGIKMFVQRNEHFDLNKSKFYNWLRGKLRLTESIENENFTVVKNGVRYFTPLFLVLIMVEFMDLVFAVDSIPAIFAVTDEPFLVFASNALAILGLRSMYFLIADLMDKFRYLKEGLSIILVWVGLKMIVSHALFKIPTWVSLVVITLVIAISIIASFRKADSNVK
ncbi:MAG: TerC family protein [Actinomycetales bacterium]|nr:TerC family protein [Actinomycetales bacterium]